MSGVDVTGFSIHDNTIRRVRKEAILLGGASGGFGTIAGNTISDVAGANPANGIDIVTTAAGANIAISGNTMSGVIETGVRVQFTGAGGGTLSVTGNTLTNVGTDPNRRGIDVDAAGTAPVTSTISGNIVDNTGVASIGRSGIQVNASSTGPHAARVTGNTVNNANPGEGGVEAQTALGSALCLQMTGNATDSGMRLDNRAPGTLRVEGTQATFEAANNSAAEGFTYLPNVAAISFVAVGTCGFAP